MIANLRGTLLAKSAQYAVIDCQGVGYHVIMSEPSLKNLGEIGQEVSVLIHTQVSQDAIRLFGFIAPEERLTFEALIAVSGIGPKLAMSVLSAIHCYELAAAVNSDNKVKLTHIPGIGAKTAARLILELKGRLPEGPVPTTRPTHTDVQEDLVSALVNLGFKPIAAQEAARLTFVELPKEKDLAVLVRHALRSIKR